MHTQLIKIKTNLKGKKVKGEVTCLLIQLIQQDVVRFKKKIVNMFGQKGLPNFKRLFVYLLIAISFQK